MENKNKKDGKKSRLQKKMSKKPARLISGGIIGIINGFFGSGGGIISVQALESGGLEQKKSHATSLLLVLPLSLVSAGMYLINGKLTWDTNALYLLIGAAAGGIGGALLLGKLKTVWVDAIFTLLIIASGIRMVF